jgi:hypothetical protein
MAHRCRFRAGAGAGLGRQPGLAGTGEIGGAPGSSLPRAPACLALAPGAAAAPRQAAADGLSRHIKLTGDTLFRVRATPYGDIRLDGIVL